MAQIIIRHDDGSETVVREVFGRIVPYDVMFRKDYFAIKAWSREDIEIALEMIGEEGSEDLIDKILREYDLRFLEDCTVDWENLENILAMAVKELRDC